MLAARGITNKYLSALYTRAHGPLNDEPCEITRCGVEAQHPKGSRGVGEEVQKEIVSCLFLSSRPRSRSLLWISSCDDLRQAFGKIVAYLGCH